jgi:hypothetical protein
VLKAAVAKTPKEARTDYQAISKIQVDGVYSIIPVFQQALLGYNGIRRWCGRGFATRTTTRRCSGHLHHAEQRFPPCRVNEVGGSGGDVTDGRASAGRSPIPSFARALGSSSPILTPAAPTAGIVGRCGFAHLDVGSPSMGRCRAVRSFEFRFVDILDFNLMRDHPLRLARRHVAGREYERVIRVNQIGYVPRQHAVDGAAMGKRAVSIINISSVRPVRRTVLTAYVCDEVARCVG